MSMKSLILFLVIYGVYADLAFLNESNADKKTKKCPAFECGMSDDKKCIEGSGKWADGDKTWTYNGCEDDNMYCKTTGIPEGDNMKGQCTKKTDTTESYKPKSQFPGEPCLKDADCADVHWNDGTTSFDTPKCGDDGKCQGATTDQLCSTSAAGGAASHQNCQVGNYCDTTGETSKCLTLLDAGAECEKYGNLMCKAGTYCIRKKAPAGEETQKWTCTEAYTLPQFTSLLDYEEMISGVSGPDNIQSPICKSMCDTEYEHSSICATIDYLNPDDSRNGFLECDVDTQCEYKIVFGEDGKYEEDKQPCQCSHYSKIGQGYCPYANHNNVLLERFQAIRDMRKSERGRDLHTLHRYTYNPSNKKDWSLQCLNYYENPTFKEYQSCIFDKTESVENDFDNEDRCTVFSGSSMLSFSSLLSLLMLLLL